VADPVLLLLDDTDQIVAESFKTPVPLWSRYAGVAGSPGQRRPADGVLMVTPVAPQKLGPGGIPCQCGAELFPTKWWGRHDRPPSNEALTTVRGVSLGTGQVSPSATRLISTASVSLSTA
jgi:hypothetical protein